MLDSRGPTQVIASSRTKVLDCLATVSMSRPRASGGWQTLVFADVSTRFATRELVSATHGGCLTQLKRNSRMLSAQHDIFALSDQVVQHLIDNVVAEMGELEVKAS